MFPMTRLDDNALALHLEVALAVASPSLLGDLQHRDRYRRSAAISTLARHLADRMRCFDVAMTDDQQAHQPSLFA
jgi:hypothetical protein